MCAICFQLLSISALSPLIPGSPQVFSNQRPPRAAFLRDNPPSPLADHPRSASASSLPRLALCLSFFRRFLFSARLTGGGVPSTARAAAFTTLAALNVFFFFAIAPFNHTAPAIKPRPRCPRCPRCPDDPISRLLSTSRFPMSPLSRCPDLAMLSQAPRFPISQ